MTEEKIKAIEALLETASHEHGKAFIDTDGDDPEWPAWYAKYLIENGINDLLPGSPDLDTLAIELSALDEEFRRSMPDEGWEEYWSPRLFARFA